MLQSLGFSLTKQLKKFVSLNLIFLNRLKSPFLEIVSRRQGIAEKPISLASFFRYALMSMG